MINEEARAEAEQQYPALNPDAEELTYPRAALRQGKRSAFIKGALWAISRPAPPVITDEMVERGAKALWIADQDDDAWARRVVNDVFSPADDWPDECIELGHLASLVLAAALGVNGR